MHGAQTRAGYRHSHRYREGEPLRLPKKTRYGLDKAAC